MTTSRALPQHSTLVLGSKPVSAASSFTVPDHDFQLPAIGGVQDILRLTPGLVIVQHSGGGKANQYFLRGFDADHGTDLALSIDGVPINLVSHAHGQGFADTNFIIPEVVERVEISKGPYFPSLGDFDTAGAVNMVSRDGFEHSSAAVGLEGSPGHGAAGYRALVIASPKFDSLPDSLPILATFAADIGRANGPFDNPDNWDRYRLFNKLTFNFTPASTLSLTEMSYAGNWHGSGQIPARAVAAGLISRFGSIDPDEGGNTARHQLALAYKLRPTETSELRALAYAATYRFNLFSNFTLYLRNPDTGDEIEQIDRRAFYGAKLSYRVSHQVGPLTLRDDGRRRRPQRRHSRGALGHGAAPADHRRAQQRCSRDFHGRLFQRSAGARALATRGARRPSRPAFVRGRQPPGERRPGITAKWRGRRPPAQPEGESDRDRARPPAGAVEPLRELRPRFPFERRTRRVSPSRR